MNAPHTNLARARNFDPLDTLEPVHVQGKQLQLLDAVLSAAGRAREAARRDMLFYSVEGAALVNAMHDLTGADDLYDQFVGIMDELGRDPEGFRLGDDGERELAA